MLDDSKLLIKIKYIKFFFNVLIEFTYELYNNL